MKIGKFLLAGAVSLALSGAAQAQQIGANEVPLHLSRMTLGYSYFNMPGASRVEHDEALLACARLASKMISVDRQLGAGAGFGIVGGIVGGLLARAADNGAFAASLENCMVVRGWRVVKLADAEGTALSELSAEDLRARLSGWIGADAPHGTIVRLWRNDAANASVPRYSTRPGRTKNGHLSLLALDPSEFEAVVKASKEEADKKPEKVELDPKWPTKPLKVKNLAAAPEGSAIVILDIRGLTLKSGNSILLRRVGATPEDMPSITDQGPDVVMFAVGTLFSKNEGNLKAFALPPGRWRIAGMNLLPSLSFCLGSPAFVANAGDVIYAGQLDLKSEKMVPNFSLDRVRAWLAGTPAANAVRPAEYSNGWTGPCDPNAIYALEFEGYPFEPGYGWGTKAVKAAAATPAPSSPESGIQR